MNQTTPVQDVETEEDSIVATFTDLARELRLPQLEWEFLHDQGTVVVEGRPRAAHDVAACPRWAKFLGMFEVHRDQTGHCDFWLGKNGPWTIEILAEVRDAG